MLLVFLSVITVRIGKNLLNKVPVESSILADLLITILKALMENLIGPGRIIYMSPYKPKTAKADDN